MASKRISDVQFVSGLEPLDQVEGRFLPQRVYADPIQTSQLLMSSEESLPGGNGFNFIVDLKTEIVNARTVQLSSLIIPLLPTINDKNNVIQVVHADGSGSTTLANGWYSPQSLVNELNYKLGILWASFDPTNTVNVAYNSEARTMTITDTKGESWYFVSTCSFIQYAKHVVSFDSGLASNAVSHVSTSLQMVYSRFVTVFSRSLTNNNRLPSRMTKNMQSNILCIVDLLSGYGADQFTPGSSFPSTGVVLYTSQYAPVINTLNRDQRLRVIDIEIQDEFGFNVYDLYNSGFDYPTVANCKLTY